MVGLRRVVGTVQYFSPAGVDNEIMVYITCLSIGLWVSYLFSAYGFLRSKKWAFVLYYFQFPLRVGFCTGSLSFLAPIVAAIGSFVPFYIVGATILGGEVARLIWTILLARME
ncbi:MAG TPA: hypothetical protein VMX13_06565 [Sedimentisphaerales bacterium]|nr:hypothetical protein [Sedimentisphaerales bacterium]